MRNGGVDIVLHVHQYALYCPGDALQSLCRRRGAFLFESAGNWFPPVPGYGVVYEAGCIGISFGERKTFDYGGGAVLGFSNPDLASDVQCVLGELPTRPTVSSDYEARFYGLLGEDGLPITEVDLVPLAECYRAYWIGSCPIPSIDLTLERVSAECARRTQLARVLGEALAPLEVARFSTHPLDFPWRLSFRFSQRTRLIRHLGEFGVFVSRLHPPLDAFFPGFCRSEDLTSSHRLGRQVCDLRLDRDINERAVNLVREAVGAWIAGRIEPCLQAVGRKAWTWLGRLSRLAWPKGTGAT